MESDDRMDGSPVLIGLLIFLVCCSAFFSASETALTSLSRIRLRNMVEDSKWISVKDHLPPERDSIFKKLIGLEKWREGIEGLCQRESDYVIVSVRFSDGTEKTGRARTEDGHWVELPTIGCPVVTHWRPFPKPCNGGK